MQSLGYVCFGVLRLEEIVTREITVFVMRGVTITTLYKFKETLLPQSILIISKMSTESFHFNAAKLRWMKLLNGKEFVPKLATRSYSLRMKSKYKVFFPCINNLAQTRFIILTMWNYFLKLNYLSINCLENFWVNKIQNFFIASLNSIHNLYFSPLKFKIFEYKF